MILYSLEYFSFKENEFFIQKFGECIEINKETVERYIRDLEREGYIIANNDYKANKSFFITEKGYKEIIKFKDDLSDEYIDIKSKPYQKRIKLNKILDHFKDPYEKMIVIDRLYFKKGRGIYDISKHIKSFKLTPTIKGFVNEMLKIKNNVIEKDIEDLLRLSSIYNISKKYPDKKNNKNEDIDKIILEAEILRRRGLLSEAELIYNNLINGKKALYTGQWVLCFSGLLYCLEYRNKIDDALYLLDRTLATFKNPIEKAFLKKVKADIMNNLGKTEEASKLYKTCLGLFNKIKYPVIRASILNNIGVLYFKEHKKKEAALLWEESLGIVKKLGLDWSACMTSINLADYYGLSGKTRKATRLLDDAKKFLIKIGDLEGLSEVYFNMALIQIEMGNIEEAQRYMYKANQYPLIHEKKLLQREEVFKHRLETKEK